MSDRLTQLQVCVDQLVAQMNATVNYVNSASGVAQLDPDPHSVTNLAAAAEAPEPDFDNTLNELATDIVLKSRQISMLIDSLPGIGVSEKSQLEQIEQISKELHQVEDERIAKIKEKDELLKWCESLILEVADGISQTKNV